MGESARALKEIAVSCLVALVISFLVLSSMGSFTGTVTIPSSVSIAFPPLLTGLPTADVYVVRDDNAGNYLTINGSNTKQVLQTNTNPVTALNNVLSETTWLPLNGKLVTNGTWPDFDGTVQPGRGNFTWEGWKTVATQTSSSTGNVFGIYLSYSFINITRFTYIGRNTTLEAGIDTWGANYLKITYCNFSKCQGYGGIIFNGGGVGEDISYNYVSSCFESYEIGVNELNNSVIHDNYCNCSLNGDGIGDWAYDTFPCHNVDIYSNTVVDYGQTPPRGALPRHGMYTSGTAYSNVWNNTFYSQGQNIGVDLQMYSYGCNVYNNTFSGGTYDAYGIGLSPLAGYSDLWWLSPNGTTCYNNTIINHTVAGIYSSAGGYELGNITFANNTITNCPVGIQLRSDSSSVYPQNYTIIGNIINGCSSCAIRFGYNSGVEDKNDQMKVLNNTISNCYYGLNLYAPAINPTFQYNTFSNCTVASYDFCTTSTYRSNVGLTGYYMLNVTVVGSGSTSPSGLGWQYKSGSTASVTWTPNAGYVRQNISIDGTNQNTTVSPLNVTMSANHVVIAYFTSGP